MKIKNLFLVLTCIAFLFSACSDDDEPNFEQGAQNVPQEVRDEFHKLYKDAKDVKWETVGNYHVARFNGPISKGLQVNYSSSAWFTVDGIHCQSEECILFDALPREVIEHFNLYIEMNYPDWKVDDCEIIYRPQMGLIYVIEIEKGDLEREISISQYGDILKDVIDDDDYEDILPVIIPDGLIHALEDMFPVEFKKVSIVEVDFDDNEITVDILIGTKHREIKFNMQYQWISTEYESGIREFLDILGNNYRKTKEELLDFFSRHQIDIDDIYIQKHIEVEIKDHYKKGKYVSIEVHLRSGREFEINIDKFGLITFDVDD